MRPLRRPMTRCDATTRSPTAVEANNSIEDSTDDDAIDEADDADDDATRRRGRR